jgi:hypothetical protein
MEEERHDDPELEPPLRVDRAVREQGGQDGAGDRRAEVADGDHRLAADGVEQPAEDQRAEEVGRREDDQEHGHEPRRHAEERREERAQVERDPVVGEGLADEERETQDRPAWVGHEAGAGDLGERDHLALLDLDALVRLLELLPGLLGDVALDPRDDLLGLVLPAVDEEPARALGDVAADQHDREAEHGADAEAEPPADIGREGGRQEEERPPSPPSSRTSTSR